MSEQSLRAKIDEAERMFGKGATYTPSERELILDQVVPEWLLRGRKFLTGELQTRCEKGVKALTELHELVDRELAKVMAERAKKGPGGSK